MDESNKWGPCQLKSCPSVKYISFILFVKLSAIIYILSSQLMLKDAIPLTGLRPQVQTFLTHDVFAEMQNDTNGKDSPCDPDCTPIKLNVQHLVYNRVEKCGSKATRYLFKALSERNNFTLNYYRNGKNGSFRIPVIEQVPIVELIDRPEQNLYIRHVHFIDFRELGMSRMFDYLNLVREPLQRLASQYNFYRRQGFYKAKGLSEERRNMTINECVQTNHYECKDPSHIFKIIPYFCGHDKHCALPSLRSLEQAKKHVEMHFPVVGYLESMERFLQLIEIVWPQFFRGARDTYTDMMAGEQGSILRHETPKGEPLTAKNANIMKSRLGLEYGFYYFIRQRFHCAYNNACKSQGGN